MSASTLPRNRRRGATLAESAMAIGVVALTLVVTAQLMSAARSQRRTQQQRVTAELQAANVLEQTLVRPWDELAAGTTTTDGGELVAKPLLPQATVEIEVVPEEGPPVAKRIAVSVLVRDKIGSPTVLARVVAWKFEP